MKKRITGLYNRLRATNIIGNFFNLSVIQISNTLLLIIAIPVITRNIGIAAFGVVMFSSRFSQLSGSIINWGTGQTGVRDVAYNIKKPQDLSVAIANILLIRISIFCIFLITLFCLQWFNMYYYTYILLSVPIVIAEVFNPISFFIGAEKLKLFNICNLAFNVICIAALFVLIKSPADAIWVNFILGMANTITYIILLIYFYLAFKLPYYLPQKNELFKTARENFYLTVNNISVNLQQTIIIFALPRWGYAMLLGPYTLSDRIIAQCRNLLITISNAIYPNAAQYFQQSKFHWNNYRKKIKLGLTGVFFAGSVFIFVFADFIVFILSKEHNLTTVLFLRVMAFVPTLSALNVLNVLDQLLKNNNILIFRIAVILLVIAVLLTWVALNIGSYLLIGAFTLIVEFSAWLLYEYIIYKNVSQNA